MGLGDTKTAEGRNKGLLTPITLSTSWVLIAWPFNPNFPTISCLRARIGEDEVKAEAGCPLTPLGLTLDSLPCPYQAIVTYLFAVSEANVLGLRGWGRGACMQKGQEASLS